MALLMTLTLYVFHLRSDIEVQMQIDEIIQSFSTSCNIVRRGAVFQG
jgi:hypothetical protein